MRKALWMTSTCISHPKHSSTPILPAFTVHTLMCVHVCNRERQRERGRDGGRGGRLLYLTGDPQIFWKGKIFSSIRFWKSLTLTHSFILLKGKGSSSEMTCYASHSPKHNQLLPYNSIKVLKCSSNEKINLGWGKCQQYQLHTWNTFIHINTHTHKWRFWLINTLDVLSLSPSPYPNHPATPIINETAQVFSYYQTVDPHHSFSFSFWLHINTSKTVPTDNLTFLLGIYDEEATILVKN